MTWIRHETDSADNEVIGDLALALHLEPGMAYYHYWVTLECFGRVRVDGRADKVTDVTLEEWARWRGKRGRFAAAFRSRCVTADKGGRDPVGVVRGWWRQAKLLERQQRDAKKRHGGKRPPLNPQETPTEPPLNPRGFPQQTPTEVVGNGNGTTSTVTRRDPNAAASAPEGAPAAVDGQTLAELAGMDTQTFERHRADVKAGLMALRGKD